MKDKNYLQGLKEILDRMPLKSVKRHEYNTCPKCGGTDQYRPPQSADINSESATVAVCVECENCGFEYFEIYRFAEIATEGAAAKSDG